MRVEIESHGCSSSGGAFVPIVVGEHAKNPSYEFDSNILSVLF